MWRSWSIAARLFAANLVFVLLLAAGMAVALVLDAGSRTHEQTRLRMESVVMALADSPMVLEAAEGTDPSAVLQPYAVSVMRDARVDFVTFMDPAGIRWSHPNPEQIGKPYVGSISQAQAGQVHSETTAGTLGPSVRVIAPIKDASGTVRGMVAAGVTVSNVQVLVAARMPAVAALAAALFAAGSLAAWLLGRYLKRVTLGWGPKELGQLFVYYESVLHSVREGLVLVDPSGRLVLYNDHAAKLLGLAEPPAGPANGRPSFTTVDSLELPDSLGGLLRSGRTATDEVHLAGDRMLVVSQRPAVVSGSAAPSGTVVTLRDHTELTRLAGSLSSTETLVEALRSQTHEHANRLHAIISLIELGRTGEALEFAAADHAAAVALASEHVGSLDEPYLAALLLGKQAQAGERGVALDISGSGTLPPGALDARELVTLLGNLVDNAIDAAAGHSPEPTVWADLLVADGTLTITVADNGPGLPTTDLDVLGRIGTSGKESVAPGGRGYGIALIRRAAAALGGTVAGENDGGAVMTAVVPLPPQTSLQAQAIPGEHSGRQD
ncbi:histidine kinase [Arthrobacter stackebrandtii]|nr:histidine kinase [Arthrobacter stackebrandtii]